MSFHSIWAYVTTQKNLTLLRPSPHELVMAVTSKDSMNSIANSRYNQMGKCQATDTYYDFINRATNGTCATFRICKLVTQNGPRQDHLHSFVMSPCYARFTTGITANQLNKSSYLPVDQSSTRTL